ncbi:CPBP family glutamic-type intramembrane protease [Frigidibacter sp. RF13]|uniref:CPBP family glutamic-type intramembrane protease n=1 Tax=Frigidibacter sp. RF13 TaxID=2997340 RepID=UPI00226DA3C3|nr:CPBP family glutamic-type intramembrane protease [Frigidibacter sp. RF13]MCY1126312.1 CPBP family glutamic-type intramembrane protease [Frigidibacter sp. RF13]
MHKRLWLEFLLLFLAVPLAVALFLPPRLLFPALFVFSLVGLVLLARTSGFRWRELVSGGLPWRPIALFVLVTALASGAVIAATRPEAAFLLPLERPLVFLMIVCLYPVLSALPQELIFRPLFFRRYGPLLPRGQGALLLNAAAFSFAHLMYWSATVAVMTFAGGLFFAQAYLRHGFPLALLLHAVAGWIIFGFGLGIYFYSGNVVRPF